MNHLFSFCSTDGGYTQWSKWSSCDKTCGGGIQTRSRVCTNPVPEFGGRDCTELGTAFGRQKCNEQTCEFYAASVTIAVFTRDTFT